MYRNQKIYQFYRIFSYDYLFYSVISYLYLTITKGLSISQIMYLGAFFFIDIAIVQIPTNYIVEKIGLKKSMILGNLFWIINCSLYIISNNFIFFFLADIIAAFGTTLKQVAEPQLLHASIDTEDEDKKFCKIEGKAVSWYFYLEAISALFVGALFTVNQYIPMVLTLTMILIAFVTSMFFEENEKIKEVINDHKISKSDIKDYLHGFRVVLNSSRIKSIFIYSFTVTGFIAVTKIIQRAFVENLNVSAIEFSIIFAILTLFIGIGSRIQNIFERVTKRKTLTIIGIGYTSLILALGIINISIHLKVLLMFISVIILVIQSILQGVYRISIKKYINNFTTSKVRGKILSLFYIFESIGQALLLFISGYIIDNFGINFSTIAIGIFSVLIVYIITKYMKKRTGLNAEDYDSTDRFEMEDC